MIEVFTGQERVRMFFLVFFLFVIFFISKKKASIMVQCSTVMLIITTFISFPAINRIFWLCMFSLLYLFKNNFLLLFIYF